MITRSCCRAFQCVAIDLNTQRDFCETGRAFPVANLDELIPSLRRVIAWVKRNQTPIVSSIEAHREYELSDSGNPIHCVDGSDGQEKIDFTVLANRKYVPSDNTLSVPVDLFASYQQVIFWKRTDDLLSNPKADRLLTQAPINEFLLFGVGVETSIKALALALMARGKKVTIVQDACGYWSAGTADQAIRQMVAKGATIVTVAELLARKLDRKVRYGTIPGHVRLHHSLRPGATAPAIAGAPRAQRAARLPIKPDNPRIARNNGQLRPHDET